MTQFNVRKHQNYIFQQKLTVYFWQGIPLYKNGVHENNRLVLNEFWTIYTIKNEHTPQKQKCT